jgi:hypothetical protein
VLRQRALEDRVVGDPDGGAESARHLRLVRPAVEPISREAMRTAISLATSTGGVSAHPVRDDEDAAVGEHEVVVFVAGPDDAYVGTGSTGEVHGAPLSQQHERDHPDYDERRDHE